LDKRKYQIKFFIKVFILLLFFFTSFIKSQDIYKAIRILHPNFDIINKIQNLGIGLDHIGGKPGFYIDISLSEMELELLESNDIDFEIIIDDLTKFYKDRDTPPVSRDFPLGSMMGNYTWGELNERFEYLQALYSEIISEKLIIGQSIEGNDIWAFKLSDNPNIEENEPEVLFTGLTHAREPMSMMNLFYFIQVLCESYFNGEDPDATYLIQEREIWFIPVINPDGYIYNETIAPDGGGMHRKNRKNTNCGNGTGRGVDLNRNYGFGWGADDTGSSPNPCNNTYRGESEFSEPETQAVKQFIEGREFVNVLHYHSYGNMYIHPYGDSSLPDEPDITIFRELAQSMSKYNGFSIGTGFEMVGYTVNGDAVDWSYGDQNIYSYTPEVGSSSHGFWPPSDLVEDICRYQYSPNKIFAFSAGSDFILADHNFENNIINPGDSLNLRLDIQNRGLSNSDGPLKLIIEPLSNLFQASMINYEEIYFNKWQTGTFNIKINISEEIVYFSKLSLKVSFSDSSSYFRSDTIDFFVGIPTNIYSEDFDEGIGSWVTTGDWGLINDTQYGVNALTDSPIGNYSAEQTSEAVLSDSLNLDFIRELFISFDAKWDIEQDYDFVRFQAKTINNEWITLQGKYTQPGSGATVQPIGEHGYDGTQAEWVQEKIFLSQLNGQIPTSFRFIQDSDENVEGDGFIVDNFRIQGFLIGLMGDIIPDGNINIIDIIALSDFIFFDEDANEYVQSFCDMNNDSDINIFDLLILVNIVKNN